MKTKNIAYMILLFGAAPILFGCGNPDLGRVAGTVTYEGKPLEKATISFLPEAPDGIFAVATTDRQGHYILAAPIKKGMTQGALAGRYNVIVAKKEVVPDPDEILFLQQKISYDELQNRNVKKKENESKTHDLIPPRYGNPQTSGLHADVKAKTRNEFNFDLTK